MKLITLRDQIREVADEWFKFYPNDFQGIGEKLRELDLETATPEDVARIIGNPSWACPKNCDECGLPSEVVIQLGEEPDFENSIAVICSNCLEHAVELTKGLK